MRSLCTATSFVLLLLFATSSSAKVIGVPEIFQQQTMWCWAANTHCVLEYYGNPMVQCEIVEYAHSNNSCCASPGSCNNGGSMNNIQDPLDHFGSIDSYNYSGALSQAEIIEEIDNYRPFVIGWWMGGGGHVVVGHGYQDDDVYVMDPWMTEGYKVVTYSYCVSGGGHTWSEGIQMTTDPTCVCTEETECCDGCMPLADGTDCASNDVCAPDGTCLAGLCDGTPVPDGTPCDDADACTQTDSCQSGVCTGDEPVECTPSDQCHAVGVCDPGTGACSDPLQEDGYQCDDGDGCTQTDTCEEGVCTGADPVTCTASDQCHDVGVCQSATGLCTDPPLPDATTCDDNDACTQLDGCIAGECTGEDPVVCQAQDQCHQLGVCDPVTGVCSDPAQPDGTDCDDGDGCTQIDTCEEGACTGTDPVVCTASDQCHDAGLCDPLTGTCSDPAKPDGTDCNDANLCTQTDSCQAGVCTGTNPVTCPESDPCMQAGSCDPATGECPVSQKEEGAPCDDGNMCTLHETCQAGECTGGNEINCDDGDDCTLNDCNPDTGCVFTETECEKASGCGCGLPGQGSSPWGAALLLGLVLIAAIRRRV
jgi:MYXO-CTERM domain-containing protein